MGRKNGCGFPKERRNSRHSDRVQQADLVNEKALILWDSFIKCQHIGRNDFTITRCFDKIYNWIDLKGVF